MGSFSRMIRAQSQHAPGYVSSVGLGTFVDPQTGTGGALNDKAKRSAFDLVSRVNVHGKEYLMYRAIPIDVAIIRATTADLNGNLSFEEESVICDQLNIAMAAKNSGGVVIAQVKRVRDRCRQGLSAFLGALWTVQLRLTRKTTLNGILWASRRDMILRCLERSRRRAMKSLERLWTLERLLTVEVQCR